MDKKGGIQGLAFRTPSRCIGDCLKAYGNNGFDWGGGSGGHAPSPHSCTCVESVHAKECVRKKGGFENKGFRADSDFT
jgi:hypothetical protein